MIIRYLSCPHHEGEENLTESERKQFRDCRGVITTDGATGLTVFESLEKPQTTYSSRKET